MKAPQSIDCGNYTTEIIRTRRVKSIGIRVEHQHLSLRVPKRMPMRDIQRLLLENRPWIEKKIQEQALQFREIQKHYRNGENFTYLGRDFRLKITDGPRSHNQLDNNTLNLSLPKAKQSPEHIYQALSDWYKEAAKVYFKDRVAHFEPKLQVRAAMVKVRRCKSRWGSCSSEGNINFNWLLIMAKPWIIDYVVIHELCHLIEHNHSTRFWALVESQMPNYKAAKAWLNTHGYRLTL